LGNRLIQRAAQLYGARNWKHAKDLETLMAVLSAREMRELYRSLKKLGLLAAEKLDQPGAEVKSSKEQAKK
jgi:hypothetical protein